MNFFYKKSKISTTLLLGLILNSGNYAESLFVPYSTRPEDIQFLLYTKNADGSQQSQPLQYGNLDSVKESQFCPELPTVILIHGYWCDRNSNFPSKVRDAYLETLPTTQNYIVVDWGRLSHPNSVELFKPVLFPLAYPLVVLQNIPIVSQRVADFIQWLSDSQQVSLKSLHIVGHSLGAHISGSVGHILQNENGKNRGEKVGRITGLDPAGPFIDSGLSLARRLRRDDATFTDVYHTALGTRGTTTLDGHADFYPNGGVYQPLCPEDSPSLMPTITDPIEKGSCSHEFSSDIYAATIRRSVPACKCSYRLRTAELEKCMKLCPDLVLAGEKCPNTAEGIYYFTTEDDSRVLN